MKRPLLAATLTLLLALAGAMRAEHACAGAVEADQAVAQAREAAASHRNAESMALYEQAIAEEPSWRLLWLRELADQMTYAGFAGEAVPLYEEYLDSGTASPEDALRARLGLALALSWTDQLEQSLKEYEALLADDPGNRDAQLGRARVLSWRDRQGPSRAAYAEVLAQDPLNAEARRSLGRVQSWRGRQRDAQRQLSEYVADNPDDNEGVFLLAQSQDWMGRPDKAKQTLQRHLQTSPDDTRSRELLSDIEFRERPATRVDYQESHQSDQLTIRGISTEQDVFLNDGRTVVGPRYQFYHFNQKNTGVDDIDVNRAGLYARHRISDSLLWAGAAFIDLIDVEGARKDREIFTYDTSLTYWPNDLLRFDVGSSRTTFDNMTSLRRGIAANFANFSVDVTPDELTRITGRYNWGDFTDDNVRNWGQAEIERRIWNHPALFVRYQYTGFDFRREFSNGYYNPDTYNSNELTMRTTGRLGERFTYQFDGGYGTEQATPGGQQAIWRAGTSLNYSIVDRLTVGGRYNYFSSATASSGGFERGTTGVNVQFVW